MRKTVTVATLFAVAGLFLELSINISGLALRVKTPLDIMEATALTFGYLSLMVISGGALVLGVFRLLNMRF